MTNFYILFIIITILQERITNIRDLGSETPIRDGLFELGIPMRRSRVTESVLGCVACAVRNSEEGDFHGSQILRCLGIKSGSLYPILKRLTDRGVLEKRNEGINPVEIGRPERKIYTPSDEVREFFKSMNTSVNENCPMVAFFERAVCVEISGPPK